MSHRRVEFLTKGQERVSKHRNIIHSRREMLAYSFLKSETTGASVFSPPVTPSSAQYALGDTYEKRTNPGQDMPRKAKRCAWEGGEVFLPAAARQRDHSHCWFREVRSQTGTAEICPRKQESQAPEANFWDTHPWIAIKQNQGGEYTCKNHVQVL